MDSEEYTENKRNRSQKLNLDKNKLATLIILTIFLILMVLSIILLLTKKQQDYNFYMVCLGARGGLDLSDLSAYLLAEDKLEINEQRNFISLDSGNILNGIKKGYLADAFLQYSNTNNNLTITGDIFRERIKGKKKKKFTKSDFYSFTHSFHHYSFYLIFFNF